jgi:hypothetical protein
MGRRSTVPLFRALAALLVTISLESCGFAGRMESDPGHADVADPSRACAAHEVELTDSLAQAARCAEGFIDRNGYTDRAVSDTQAIADESIEWQQSALEVLRSRRNTLSPGAVVVCRGASGDGPGYIVAFNRPGHTVGQAARAVTMTGSFRGLRVQHMDFMIDRALADSSGRCSAL